MSTTITYDMVEIVLSEYRGENTLPKDKVDSSVIDLLEESRSIYTCLAYENCLRFNIPYSFIVLTIDLDGMSKLLFYEILHANKIGLLTDEFTERFLRKVYEGESVPLVAREICEVFGFKFKDKKGKKNPLFRVHEGIYELSPFPILDSTCSLSKTWTSKKYIPSDLLVGRVTLVSKSTMKAIVERLNSTSSPVLIIETLLRYSTMYDSFELSKVLQQINLRRVTNSPRVLLLAQEILGTVINYLDSETGEEEVTQLGTLLHLVHSV